MSYRGRAASKQGSADDPGHAASTAPTPQFNPAGGERRVTLKKTLRQGRCLHTHALLLQYALLLPRLLASGRGSECRGSLVGGGDGHY